MAVALATLAGAVDGIGFSNFGGLYVSFMSGNTTQFGISLAGGEWGHVGHVLMLIGFFVLGVFCGELMGAAVHHWRGSVVLAADALVLAGAAAIAARSPGDPAMIARVMALAMGLQNAPLHRTAAQGVALTYVTGTLVHFGRSAADMIIHRARPRASLRFLGLWLGLGIGAALGSGLVRIDPVMALAAASGAAAILSFLALFLRPTENQD